MWVISELSELILSLPHNPSYLNLKISKEDALFFPGGSQGVNYPGKKKQALFLYEQFVT